jgi:hypothetical protein
MHPAAALLYRSHSNDMVGIYVAIFVVFIVIAIVAWYFSKANRLKRALRDAKAMPIGQLPENTPGKVVGQAHPVGQTLVGPLTGRPCLYYIAIVEQHVSTGRSSYWKQIIKEEMGVAFQVVDSSGRAIVDPRGAEVVLTFDGTSKSGTFSDADPVQEAFLQRHGQSSKGWVFNKGLRYKEAMIEINETVAILGSGIREPDPMMAPAQDYRSGPPTLLRLTSSPKFPLVISDDHTTTQ